MLELHQPAITEKLPTFLLVDAYFAKQRRETPTERGFEPGKSIGRVFIIQD